MTVEEPDKTNTLIDVDHYLPLTRKHPDAPALELTVGRFGGDALDNHLAARIRKKTSFSDEIDADVTIPEFDDHAHFGVQRSYALINLRKYINPEAC